MTAPSNSPSQSGAPVAAHNAVILEYVARMAYRTLTLRTDAAVSQALLDRHYFRKHGASATYGQKS